MLEQPDSSGNQQSPPRLKNIKSHEQNSNFIVITATVLIIVLLLGLWWSATDNPDVVIIDDSPNVIVDDDVVVATTESTIGNINNENAYQYILSPQDGESVTDSELVVTRVISDRLFEVSDYNRQGSLLAYLDDTLDRGVAENIIDVNAGDVVLLDGVVISNFANRAFTTEEEMFINQNQFLLLVDQIQFLES